MGLLQRIARILKSNINDLISRAEDPEKTLNQAIADMRHQMVEAKGRVAMAIAEQKRLERDHDRELKKAEEWEKKAMAAVKAGRDDLAIEALSKKKQHEQTSLQFSAQLDEQKNAVDQLKSALSALNEKVDEANRKKAVLVARAKRAEAQKAIAETLSITNDRSSLESFERMAEKVDQIEAEAEARMEVATLVGSSHSDKLSEDLKLLEAHTVDEDLVELKEKMKQLEAGSSETKALPAGEPKQEEDLDLELPEA